MTRRRRIFWCGWFLALVLTPQVGLGGRCATGERGARTERFRPLAPAFRRPSGHPAGRVAPPVTVTGGHAFVTENFRLLWGDAYDRADPDWADPDADGVPVWVETLADALEGALAAQRSLGFRDPPELDRYLVDVYVGNTGLVVDGDRITVSSSYYAYTDVDPSYGGAYLVVNDDFSAHTADELGVLRATAAHELFHAVQLAYYPWNDEVAVPDARWEREGWWFEATATWMEEECQPRVDDYVTYVREFLSRPELSLTSSDGLREYGAAIFPGYLWLWDGGASLWQEAFAAAFDAGLEPSLEGALVRRGKAGLAPEVAAFWSLAVHPEDGWPDGAAYRAVGTPRLLRSASSYPVDETASGSLAPGRFGASLLRLPPSEASLSLSLASLGVDAASFHLALSESGGASTRVQAVRSDGVPVEFAAAGARDRYLAVVNTDDSEGTRAFRVSVEGDVVERDNGGGSSGGCFLRALGGR